MRFNPIEFFYELLNGNPYLIGVLIFTVCISLIPIYFLALLYLFCKKGNPDANEYGPNPLQQ